MVIVAEAHSAELPPTASLRDILHHADHVLLPQNTAQEAIAAFDRFEAEALSVVQIVRYLQAHTSCQSESALAGEGD
jgi:hypothetical protein